MIPKRPINADVPASEEPTQEAPAKPPEEPQPESGVRPLSTMGATKDDARAEALIALVALALVFIVAAIVWGSGGEGEDSEAPAPRPHRDHQRAALGETPPLPSAEALGYPSFATNNTTRIGGSDPAANAAGAALAAFPSTTETQRPAAVTCGRRRRLGRGDRRRGADGRTGASADPLLRHRETSPR